MPNLYVCLFFWLTTNDKCEKLCGKSTKNENNKKTLK